MSCRPAEEAGEGGGKYEVILEDTVLFPEGGGQVISQCCVCVCVYPYNFIYVITSLLHLQPYDRGTVSEKKDF